MRILALPTYVELEAAAGGAVLRGDAVEHKLTDQEYPLFLQLCGALHRQGASPPADTRALEDCLIRKGVAMSAPQPDAWLLPDQHVALAEGVELRPALYTVVDAHGRTVGLVSALSAAILDACDGRRAASELVLPGGDEGSLDALDELSALQSSGFVEVLPPNMVLRRNVTVKRPAEAVVATLAAGNAKFVLTGEEAELLVRCGSPCRVRELLGGTASDKKWAQALLSKASVLGLATMSSPRASGRASKPTPPVAIPAPAPDDDSDLDTPTTVEKSTAALAALDAALDPPQPRPRLSPPGTPPPRAIAISTPFPAIEAPPPPPRPLLDNSAAKLESLASFNLEKNAELSPRTSKLPWFLLLVCLGGGGYYYYTQIQNRDHATTPAPAGNTAETKTEAKPSQSALLAAGYIAAKEPIVLSTIVSGRVKEVLVDNNYPIKKGQILATIDDAPARAELSLAYARIRDANRTLERTKMLIQAQAATPLELDKAVGAVEIADAQARVIKQQIEEMKIRSPVDGTVIEVIARQGEALNAGPGQGIVMRVADLRALCAEIDVEESEIKRITMHQEVEVTADAQKGQVYNGKVYEIAQQADRARGTMLVRVDVPGGQDSVLKPGMAVQVAFLPKEKPQQPPSSPGGSGGPGR